METLIYCLRFWQTRGRTDLSLALTQSQQASHVTITPDFAASWDCCEETRMASGTCKVTITQGGEHEFLEGCQDSTQFISTKEPLH